MSDSLWPHRLKHTRLLCPLLCPGVCSNSCPFSRWCYLTISSSTTLFSFCFQSFPASGSFPMSQLFASGDESTGASMAVSVLPMNIQGWFPRMKDFDLHVIQGNLKNLLQHQFKSFNSLVLSLLYGPTLTSIHDYWKNHSLDLCLSSDLCPQSDVFAL